MPVVVALQIILQSGGKTLQPTPSFDFSYNLTLRSVKACLETQLNPIPTVRWMIFIWNNAVSGLGI